MCIISGYLGQMCIMSGYLGHMCINYILLIAEFEERKRREVSGFLCVDKVEVCAILLHKKQQQHGGNNNMAATTIWRQQQYGGNNMADYIAISIKSVHKMRSQEQYCNQSAKMRFCDSTHFIHIKTRINKNNSENSRQQKYVYIGGCPFNQHGCTN